MKSGKGVLLAYSICETRCSFGACPLIDEEIASGVTSGYCPNRWNIVAVLSLGGGKEI